MAIVNNGTKNSLKDNLIPSGYTRPTVTEFTDGTQQNTLQLDVLKATVEDATRATTLTNILDNGTVGITQQITDIVTAAFDNTKTVTIWANMVALTTNIPPDNDNDFYTDTAVSYRATIQYFVKSV